MSVDARVRILVTGSREFTDVELVRAALNGIRVLHPGATFTIVHGDARGADRIARDIVRASEGTFALDEPHPAAWKRADGSTDRSAGHRRNAEMVALGASHCIAFFRDGAGNRGTTSCARLARAAGIPVIEVHQAAGPTHQSTRGTTTPIRGA